MKEIQVRELLFRMNQNIGRRLNNSKIVEEFNYEILQHEYCLSFEYGVYTIIESKLKINKKEFEIMENYFTEQCSGWNSHYDYLGELSLLVDENGINWLFVEGNIS